MILHGRPATQMAGFAGQLDDAAADALVAYLYQAPPREPQWSAEDIRASQVQPHPLATLPSRPRFEADPLNLFVVVESGDHHVTILDGDRFEPIARFPRATPCTEVRSSPRTGAWCTSPRATAG
ncbi:cytochrome C [Pseudomonas aeruginosa]|nr:cytochrome C [Pseudomonas aeruginosa]